MRSRTVNTAHRSPAVGPRVACIRIWGASRLIRWGTAATRTAPAPAESTLALAQSESGYLPTRNRSEPLALTRLAPRLPIAAYRSGLTETGTGLYDHPVPMMDDPRARRPILISFGTPICMRSFPAPRALVVSSRAPPGRSILRPFDDLGKRKAEGRARSKRPAVGK